MHAETFKAAMIKIVEEFAEVNKDMVESGASWQLEFVYHLTEICDIDDYVE